MDYTFTDNQLETIRKILSVSPWVSDAYRWYMGLPIGTVVIDCDPVEDFAIAFYTAYNRKYPGTY